MEENDPFRIILVDYRRKVKINISLTTGDGKEVNIEETVKDLLDYLKKQLTAANTNIYQQQIMPLMAQSLTSAMLNSLDIESASIILASERLRQDIIGMMMLSFTMMKWMQKNNVKILTTETPISSEEIESISRVSIASDLSAKYALAGGDPTQIISSLVKSGKLSTEDLRRMGLSSGDLVEEVEEPKKNNLN